MTHSSSDLPRCQTVLADPSAPAVAPGEAFATFASPRRTLWGTGQALRIELPAPWPDHVGRVAETLDAIPVDDQVGVPGTGPVAFGALPFDRAAPATLVVPAVSHGSDADGNRWVTRFDTPDATEGYATSGRVEAGPSTVTVSAGITPRQWDAMVTEATTRIQAGELTKVVLARELALHADADFDPYALIERLRVAYPAALTFCIDGFLGASPEMLVSRIGDVVRAQPMAGTTPRTGDVEADRRRADDLLASEKNRAEHRITIDMVHDTLLPWCSFLDSEPTPSVVPAGPVQHLATMVEGHLSAPAAPVLDLVAALHPTPAVGGWPRDRAIELLEQLEGVDRGRYAGPVGWTDARGNGTFAVGIRSAELDGPTARMFTGVGIVADSDPVAELEETRAKARALLGELIRP